MSFMVYAPNFNHLRIPINYAIQSPSFVATAVQVLFESFDGNAQYDLLAVFP